MAAAVDTNDVAFKMAQHGGFSLFYTKITFTCMMYCYILFSETVPGLANCSAGKAKATQETWKSSALLLALVVNYC